MLLFQCIPPKKFERDPRDPDIYSRAGGGVAVLFVKELLGHATSHGAFKRQ
jgi:hypothetical protein